MDLFVGIFVGTHQKDGLPGCVLSVELLQVYIYIYTWCNFKDGGFLSPVLDRPSLI